MPRVKRIKKAIKIYGTDEGSAILKLFYTYQIVTDTLKMDDRGKSQSEYRTAFTHYVRQKYGDEVCDEYWSFYRSNKDNKKIIKVLGKKKKDYLIQDTLAGLRFCITGGISGYERPDIERIIKQHNGRMTESISSKTDYLVLGTYDLYGEGYISNKQKDALEIISKGGKIQIINAEKFFALVNGNKE